MTTAALLRAMEQANAPLQDPVAKRALAASQQQANVKVMEDLADHFVNDPGIRRASETGDSEAFPKAAAAAFAAPETQPALKAAKKALRATEGHRELRRNIAKAAEHLRRAEERKRVESKVCKADAARFRGLSRARTSRGCASRARGSRRVTTATRSSGGGSSGDGPGEPPGSPSDVPRRVLIRGAA